MTTSQRKYSNYSAGSYLSILPRASNSTISLAEKVIRIEENEKFLRIDKSNNFEIYSNIVEKYPHFCRFIEKKFLGHSEIFEFFVDFTGVLKKSHINNIKLLFEKKIKNFSNENKQNNQNNQNNLNLLNSYDILFSNYSQLIAKNKICLLDFLKSLNNLNLCLDLNIPEIFEFFPMKYPRNYSLISNPVTDEDKFEIVFTLVKEKIQRKFNVQNTPIKIEGFEEKEIFFFGQCTNYLNSTELNDKVIITDIKNDFIFPLNCLLENSKPILYFCNGTGITPCISFLKQLNFSVSKNQMDNKVGNFAIFTGFRNASEKKNETIYEDYILNTVDCLNEKIARDTVVYKRCLSNDEGKFFLIF